MIQEDILGIQTLSLQSNWTGHDNDWCKLFGGDWNLLAQPRGKMLWAPTYRARDVWCQLKAVADGGWRDVSRWAWTSGFCRCWGWGNWSISCVYHWEFVSCCHIKISSARWEMVLPAALLDFCRSWLPVKRPSMPTSTMALGISLMTTISTDSLSCVVLEWVKEAGETKYLQSNAQEGKVCRSR